MCVIKVRINSNGINIGIIRDLKYDPKANIINTNCVCFLYEGIT